MSSILSKLRDKIVQSHERQISSQKYIDVTGKLPA